MAVTPQTGASGFVAPDLPPENVYNQCVRCGLCLPTCPTYAETLVETSSPRGRIALIKAVDEGRLPLTSPGFVHQMHECLDCRACEAVCPSGVAYGQLLEAARAQVVRATAGESSATERFLRDFALRRLLGSMSTLRAVAGALRFYQRSGLRRFARSTGLLRLLGLERLEAAAPDISSRFFSPGDARYPARGKRAATAFMHAGCVMQVAFAETDDATVRLLQRAGCDVVAPSDQGCCGALAVHAGELEFGRTLAKRTIAAFERSGADVYAVNAAGCGSALKEYGGWLAGDSAWAERAGAFSARVRDVTEILDALDLPQEMGRVDAVVVYQDPCHLLHAQRVANAPRRLLARIPGVHLREAEEAALCCGSAGTYNLTQPQMSERLRRRKIANLLAVEPDVIATANPGCAMQLRAGLREAGRSVPVRHVLDLLDEAYENYNPTSRASPASAPSMLG